MGSVKGSVWHGSRGTCRRRSSALASTCCASPTPPLPALPCPQALYEEVLEGFLDLLDREIKVGMEPRAGRGAHGCSAVFGLRHPASAVGLVPAFRPPMRLRGAAGLSSILHMPHALIHACSLFPLLLQPLIPSREDEYQFGLPKPLSRWRNAEPLLEEDARCSRMPPEFRWGLGGGLRWW